MQNERTRAAEFLRSEETENTYTLSFSSEEPYLRYYGLEILDHADGAMDLTRLNSIGVLLFNHDTDRVVGRIVRAWVEDHRGMAEVTFDDDEEAEKIRRKVDSGTLKAVSVRYSVESWESVETGHTSTDGRFTGPCDIARKWTPLEVSIVSVPADPTVGVGRSADEDGARPGRLKAAERQTIINRNRLGGM